MAQVYSLNGNKENKEEKQKCIKARRRCLVLALIFLFPTIMCVYLAVSFFEGTVGFEILLFVGVVLLVCCVFFCILAVRYTVGINVLHSGESGENHTANYLSRLPENYLVFQNVPLQHGERKTELDFLVISCNGIFIVEVKNHTGYISGDAKDKYWEQDKISSSGNPYFNEMKNPLKQLGFQIFLLSQKLKAHGVRVWIDGLVFMPGADEVSVNSDKVVDSPQKMIKMITETKPRKEISVETLNKIVQVTCSPH